ncbi:MAG: aspartyl protease family protein [Saprospiraceae bacterium]|nr:aspartyl protease family protein [Saprospiraceae bacterium]
MNSLKQFAALTFTIILWSTSLCAERRPDISLPFEVFNNLIILNLQVNGSPPLKFIFDTGSEHSLFFERGLADLLKIKISRTIQIYGSDLSRPIDAFVGRDVNFEAMNKMAMKADIIVLDENIFQFTEYLGTRISGIIGNSLFRSKVIELDFDHLMINVYSPNGYNPDRHGYNEIAGRWIKGKPYIESDVSFTDSVREKKLLLLDTGASIGLLLYAEKMDTSYMPSKLIPGMMGMGLGGPIQGYIGRIGEIQIGERRLKNVVTHFQHIQHRDTLTDLSGKEGIVGNLLISRFNVVLDYHFQHIYLKTNRSSKKKVPVDRSGLYIVATGENLNEFEIRRIMPGTAGEEAGLEVGDKIIRFNRFSARNFTLGDINRHLSNSKRKKIHLTILRNGEKIKKTLFLRDII